MYGAATSWFVTLKANRETLDYDSLNKLTNSRSCKNKVGAELGYRIGSATTAVLDVTQTYVRYDNQTGIETQIVTRHVFY